MNDIQERLRCGSVDAVLLLLKKLQCDPQAETSEKRQLLSIWTLLVRTNLWKDGIESL